MSYAQDLTMSWTLDLVMLDYKGASGEASGLKIQAGRAGLKTRLSSSIPRSRPRFPL